MTTPKAQALSDSIRDNEFNDLILALVKMGILTTPEDAAAVAMVAVGFLLEFASVATGIPMLTIAVKVPAIREAIEAEKARLLS